MGQIDHNKVERFFMLNKHSKAIHFYFYDEDGLFSSKSKKPFVTIEVYLANGELFTFSDEEWRSFGDRLINIGISTKEQN